MRKARWFRYGFYVLMATFVAAAIGLSLRTQQSAVAAGAGDTVFRLVNMDVTLGEPIYYEGLTVVPILAEKSGSAQFKTLEQAIADGQVEVTEVDESGSVPELLVRNKGDDKLLIVDGEELVGAKQNRIVNITMIIEGNSEIRIPVSCVEHGRWSSESDKFSSGASASAGMRSKNAAGVQDSIKDGGNYEAGQYQVWDEVARLNFDLGVTSSSDAMNDGYKSIEEKLEKFAAAIKMPPNAVGYLAFAGDKPLAGDVFASSEIFHAKWDKFLKSAAIEIIRMGEDNKPEPATRAAAGNMLRTALDSVTDSYTPPGQGTGYHIQGEKVVGNMLQYEGELVHMSVFPRPDESATFEDPMIQPNIYENQLNAPIINQEDSQ